MGGDHTRHVTTKFHGGLHRRAASRSDPARGADTLSFVRQRTIPRVPISRLRSVLVLFLLAAATQLLAACDDGAARDDGGPSVASPEAGGARLLAPSPTPVIGDTAGFRTLAVRVQLSNPTERERVALLLESAPMPDGTRFTVSASLASVADLIVSDRPLDGGTAFVVEAWAVIAHQRADVLALSMEQLREVVRGGIDDWSALGGAARPLRLLVAAGGVGALASSIDFLPEELAADVDALEAVLTAVEGDRGALGIVPASALRPGVLALLVDGHDPYRDPWLESPLAVRRWIGGADADALAEVASRLDLDGYARGFLDPVGVLATGELIPARCTNAVLEAIGDFGAMFDGTRALLEAADLLIVPLEVSLTDRSPPTPCTRTFLLQGRAEVVGAVEEVGVDVMLTVGNHMMDCWEGCSRGASLLDTLRRLDAARVAHVGAAADLAGARAPVVVERGGLRFAFLAYDSIAPYYAATPDSPDTAPLDLDTLAEDVRRAAEQSDHVIVGFNWGVEYTADPTAFQRAAAALAVDAGAVLVIGNHPHWVQAVELLDGAIVAYALGNFVFDQDWSIPTTRSMTLEVGFNADRPFGFRLRPLVIRGDVEHRRGLYRPEFIDPAGAGAPILQRVWEATDRLSPRAPSGR